MPPTDFQTAAHEYATLTVLSSERCRQLLRSRAWGRLAAGLEGWPAIIPINYGYVEDNIVFKTGPGAKLDESPMTAVAFEIDDADPEGAWGWSVLVQGPAFDITNSVDATSTRLRDTPLKTWAPGKREHWIRIAAVRVTGRAFGDVPDWSRLSESN